MKLKEKDGNKSVLSGVPAALPSLIKAYRIQDKARNVGFDWEEREQVWDKVKEEIGEFQEEVANMDKEKAEAEFGDVMFSLINAARLYKINPDNALELIWVSLKRFFQARRFFSCNVQRCVFTAK